MEQPECTTDGSTCSPETTLSGSLAGAVAAEVRSPYLTETNASFGISKAPCAATAVEFMDIHGRKFRLPMEECCSIDCTRTLVAREINAEKDSFEFWVGDFLITSGMWASEVKLGAVIVLRPPVTSGSPLFPPPSPPPPPPPPQTPTSQPASAPLLKHSEIWNAKGWHTLPFSGCGNRTFHFVGHSIPASLESLNLYWTLRVRTPPERWSDLHGNTVACGRVTTPDHPQVNIGPVLAGHLRELQDIRECSYVLILKAELLKNFREKDVSAHLDGDSIYQWVSYPSREHAHAGLSEFLGLGYSIVGNWVELDVSRVSTAKLAQLDGKKIVVEKRKIFAVIDAVRFTGWRRRLHRLHCIISL